MTIASHTLCGLLSSSIVIPSLTVNGEPCTAILRWPTLKWNKISNDRRQFNLADGYLISFAGNSRLLYVGGKIGTDAVDTVYEFEFGKWHLWPNRLPWFLSQDDTFTQVGIAQCLDGKMHENEDIKSMSSLDVEGEYFKVRNLSTISSIYGKDYGYKFTHEIS